MTRGRRRLAPRRSPATRIAKATAPLVTIAAVGIGVATTTGATSLDVPLAQGHVGNAAFASLADRNADRVSRDFDRSVDRAAVAGASNVRPPTAVATRWTTADLDLRATPQQDAKVLGLLESAKKVGITGRTHEGYTEVVVKGASRWVTAAYLSKDKPPALLGLSNAPCPDGSAIEGALQPAAVRVYRAVCAAFPVLSSYGGQDGHGEHVNGQAIDFMVPSHAVGEQVKDFLYAHHSQLGLFDIIWAQHIWTIQRSGEGFRSMPDRGSATANHYDHVHIRIL